MTGIVERLRHEAEQWHPSQKSPIQILREAADEIERLRGVLQELTEAAAHDLALNQDNDEDGGGWWSGRCENAIKAARSALCSNRGVET